MRKPSKPSISPDPPGPDPGGWVGRGNTPARSPGKAKPSLSPDLQPPPPDKASGVLQMKGNAEETNKREK